MDDFEEKDKIARVSILKLEHIYYKHDSLFEKIKECLSKKGSIDEAKNEVYFIEGDSSKVL